MILVKRLETIALLCVGVCVAIFAQDDVSSGDSIVETQLPAQWDLQSCIDYALQENITIRKSKITAADAGIDLKTAKAALFPSLSFSTSHMVVNRPYQETSSRVSGSEIITSDSKNSYNGSYSLSASWTVFNGNKRRNTIKQEKLNIEAAELDVATSENEIRESIAEMYIQILYASESVKVNENTLEVSTAQRDRGKVMLEVGTLSKSDFAQLESQVSSDKYQLVMAQSTLADYKLQLKQLLELDGEYEMELYLPILSDETVLAPLPNKQEVYMCALANRPEIASSQLAVEASDLEISIAKADYYPTISLSAGVNTTHANGSDTSFGEQLKTGWNNSIGLSVSVPIFNNRQTKSTVQKARLQKESTVLSLQEEQKNLYKTVESFWLEATNAQQRYAAAVDQLNSAQISFDLLQEQFNAGMKNTVELLTEKNTLLEAQQEQLQAKYMAILNAQLLRFYQGEELVF